MNLGQFLRWQHEIEEENKAKKKMKHEKLMQEFSGTGIKETPEKLIKEAKAINYEGGGVFSRVNSTINIIRKGKDRPHLEVIQWKNYYTVKEGEIVLTQRNVPIRKRYWLDYPIAFNDKVYKTTEKLSASAIRTEDSMLFRLSDAVIGEEHMPDFFYFGAGGSAFIPMGVSSGTTFNFIREKGHFFPTKLLATGDSTGFTPERYRLAKLSGWGYPWFLGGGLGLELDGSYFAGFGKRKKSEVKINLMNSLLGTSTQIEGGPIFGSKSMVGFQFAYSKYYQKVGLSLGLGAGAAVSTPTSIEWFPMEFPYRKYLIGESK